MFKAYVMKIYPWVESDPESDNRSQGLIHESTIRVPGY